MFLEEESVEEGMLLVCVQEGIIKKHFVAVELSEEGVWVNCDYVVWVNCDYVVWGELCLRRIV